MQTINRKYICKTIEKNARKGQYYSGHTLREAAHDIVKQLDLHPCFVGKLTEDTKVQLAHGTLRPIDGVVRLAQQRAKKKRLQRRRAAQLGAESMRKLHSTWHAESIA